MKFKNCLLWPQRPGLVANIGRAFVLLFAASINSAWAQQQQQTESARLPPVLERASGTAALTALKDDRYRIGPGDVLDIRVFNRPQLSRDSVRVGGRGLITMPLIKDEIQAACRTEAELAQEIAARYLRYQRNPQVDVFVKEYNSQPVAVIGAVNTPGRFQLQRRIRLLELLVLAGGPAPRAGRTIQVVHSAKAFNCESTATELQAAPGADDTAEVITVAYNLGDTLKAKDAANPFVQPGDIIKIPDAEQVFVVGNVVKPSAIPLIERVTVTRAIAISGGVLPSTKKSRVRILRESPESLTKTELFVDLKAINDRHAEDVVLQAGDIVEVPSVTGFQKVLSGLLNTIVPTLTSLPITVVR